MSYFSLVFSLLCGTSSRVLFIILFGIGCFIGVFSFVGVPFLLGGVTGAGAEFELSSSSVSY